MRNLFLILSLIVVSCSYDTTQVDLSSASAPGRDGSIPGLDRDGGPMGGVLTSFLTRRFSPTGVPTGTDYVALVQETPLVTELDWDTVNCGPTPVSGVCVPITMRNMYPSYRIQLAHMELLRLTPTAPTTNVTFDSNTSGNPGFGTSDTIGLLRYPDLEPAGAAGDRATLYWVFRSTDPGPARFTFSAQAKGVLR